MTRNEADTRAELIDPNLFSAGWQNGVNITREYYFTDGELIGGGKRAKQKYADYLLRHQGQKIAIVEAKAEALSATDGLEQVKDYAEKLGMRFVYSTNGHQIYFFDMQAGSGEYVENFHQPGVLFNRLFEKCNQKQIEAIVKPFDRSKFNPRYYQETAVNRAVETITGGQDRLLLTLATGTGKTSIAFQTVWKLYNAKWNKAGDGRRPRVLFLADRNFLIDQAMGDFNPLEEYLVRIDGDKFRKKGKAPTNGNVFFSIYQALTTDKETKLDEIDSDDLPELSSKPYYEHYPKDFFDLIIVDECHRGGANSAGLWRNVLEYFSPATQLGLTATPRCDDNVDTYDYFGQPLYTYSLKEGIEDGFLTPFKVKRVNTTLDTYQFSSGDILLSGEVDTEKEYNKNEINKSLLIQNSPIPKFILQEINTAEKTVIFCKTQAHAALVRDAINAYKPEFGLSNNADYCVRITSADGEYGNKHLRDFCNNEKSIPTIVTTSVKLTTGMDSRNIRNIVLLRNVGSMTEFKQIIGRGTRIADDKNYFTIVDFYGNDTKFADPEWDGVAVETDDVDVPSPENGSGEVNEPDVPYIDGNSPSSDDGGYKGGGCPGPPPNPPAPPKVQNIVKLSDGKERKISYSANTKYYLTGKIVEPAEFLKHLYGEIPKLFSSEEELREIWSNPKTRKQLLTTLEESGFSRSTLDDIKELVNAKNSDVYDVLRYVAFVDEPIVERSERAETVRKQHTSYTDIEEMGFIEFILQTYLKQGEYELFEENLSELLELKYETLADAKYHLGEIAHIKELYCKLQVELYA